MRGVRSLLVRAAGLYHGIRQNHAQLPAHVRHGPGGMGERRRHPDVWGVLHVRNRLCHTLHDGHPAQGYPADVARSRRWGVDDGVEGNARYSLSHCGPARKGAVCKAAPRARKRHEGV